MGSALATDGTRGSRPAQPAGAVPAAGRRLAVFVAVAVNGDGRREVLGIAIGASDAETVWTEFPRSLARRGLRGVKPVISNTHEGQRT